MNIFPKILVICLFSACVTPTQAQKITVGAKNFNEGYLLAEIFAQLIETNGYRIERKYNLGGTLVCFEALRNGEIDLYPEYTGTIAKQILKSDQQLKLPELKSVVAQRFNLRISKPLGFNNTYALAVRQKTAAKYGLKKISDLVKLPDLKFAFSYEFLKRQDGWTNLAVAYDLPQQPLGIEHGLSYQAIDQEKVDVIDIYSTDGEIPRYDLKILEDDRHFFPRYEAVAFYRPTLPVDLINALADLHFLLTESNMQNLNARVVFYKESYAEVARSFLQKFGLIPEQEEISTDNYAEIVNKTIVHLQLTGIAMLLAMVIAIPLGILIYRYKNLAKPILYFSGLLQTIPSIALLALMIPLFGIGVLPAIIALFLYALLPILRNTAIALFSIDPLLKKVAMAIGLTRWQQLRLVEIPLAMPTIFAGIKTAAVISIGTATLAAFIGAGGLGEFIVTGLSLNDTSLILKGAIPAALLAILIEFAFELLERFFVPAHLRQKIGEK